MDWDGAVAPPPRVSRRASSTLAATSAATACEPFRARQPSPPPSPAPPLRAHPASPASAPPFPLTSAAGPSARLSAPAPASAFASPSSSRLAARVIRRLPVRPPTPAAVPTHLPPPPAMPGNSDAPPSLRAQAHEPPPARARPHPATPTGAMGSNETRRRACSAAPVPAKPEPGRAVPPDARDAELAGVPTAFLEHYPFPAFVFALPSPSAPSRPLEPAWLNGPARALLSGQTLAACLVPDSVRTLSAWLETGGPTLRVELTTPQIELELCKTIPLARVVVVTTAVRASAQDEIMPAAEGEVEGDGHGSLEVSLDSASVAGSDRAKSPMSIDGGADEDDVKPSAAAGMEVEMDAAADGGPTRDIASSPEAGPDSLVLRLLRARHAAPSPVRWDRDRLEKAYYDLANELRAFSDYAPVGIFRCDAQGAVTYVNQTWREQAGVHAADVADWGESIADCCKDHVRGVWESFFQNDEVERSADWQWKNGTWVTTKVIRLEKVAPGLQGVLGCVTDITERKNNEEIQRVRAIEAEQRREEAEEARRQQELLIDTTSHEIRNPVSSLMQCAALVKTNLEAVLDQVRAALADGRAVVPTPQLVRTLEEDIEGLENIYQCGLTQERISNDVLSLGKIQLDICPVEVDLFRETDRILSAFRTEAMMKRIRLVLDMGPSVDELGGRAVKTDPVRLGQIVTNLLSNAIRFMSNSPRREIALRVELSLQPPIEGTCTVPPARPAPGWTEDTPIYIFMSVTDTGPGLSAADLAVLFQRFSQASPATHTVFGGSGLGLFVCRKIADHMGGRVDVVSTPSVGSTFRFFVQARACAPAGRGASDEAVPRVTVDTRDRRASNAAASDTDADGHPPARAQPTTPRPRRSASALTYRGERKPHVLIVEDNDLNRSVLQRQLAHVGITSEAAENGLEAIAKIRAAAVQHDAAKYDCVLMDLEMPVMSGREAVLRVRADEAAGVMPPNLVIALTGNARQGQIDEAMRCGMDAVVIKPYRLDKLLQVIEQKMRERDEARAAPAMLDG
ncbi:hypothetical protein Q5752_003129 [Cryptotrichosporon argae]